MKKLQIILLTVFGLWASSTFAQNTLLLGSESETSNTPQQSKITEDSDLQTLRGLLGNLLTEQPEFLDPDVAYRLHLGVVEPETLLAQFVIEDGYYLYQGKTKFSSQTEGVRVGPVSLPQGKKKVDEYFGEQVVYYHGLEVELPLIRSAQSSDEIVIKVDYQGCADKGLCYPPMNKLVTLKLPGISDALAAHSNSQSDTDPIVGKKAAIDTGSLVYWPIILAFAAGLALTFTPCVLPMIPILTSIVVGQGGQNSQISKTRGGLLSIVYVFGIAATYTTVGAVAGATGDQLQAYFQNPWGIGTVVLIIIILSLSMFGLYEIQMPTVVQSKIQVQAGRLKGGTLGAVFMMGAISALIVGACVSPVLMTVLGLAIERSDPFLGGMIMFSLAMGSGVFLVAFGFGAGYLLPKAGPWMDKVKSLFGVMLLGVAIYIMGALPQVPVLYLWGALLIISAVYLGALQSVPEGVSGWRYLRKGIGVLALVWGTLALLGGMTGNRDILRPINLSDYLASSMTVGGEQVSKGNVHNLFTRVSELESLDAKLSAAIAEGDPVMLDYYADWCVDCIRMEKNTFANPEVRRILENFVMIQVDVTDPRNPSTNAIKKRYGVYGPPAMLFFDATGKELRNLRRYGFMGIEEFIAHIKEV